MKIRKNIKNKFTKLAIWAGAGVLPYHVAMNAMKHTSVVIIAFHEFSDLDLLKRTGAAIHVISIGEIGKNFNLLKKEKIDHLVMIGKFDKKYLWGRTRFDFGAIPLLLKLANKRDMSIFNILAQRLNTFGIEVVSQLMYIPEQTVMPGILTKRKPSKRQSKDALYGRKIAKQMADKDIGQTVVVKEGTVIAIETVFGTDATILSIPDHYAKDSVMVKVSRTDQDMRFDIATIGITTLMNLLKKGIKVLVIESGKTILAEKEALIRFADKNKMCIIVL